MILALINLRLKTQKHILPLNFKNQIINKNQNYSKQKKNKKEKRHAQLSNNKLSKANH